MAGGKSIHTSIPKCFCTSEGSLYVWSHGNKNVGMNSSSIQLEFKHFFAKVSLLLNGSYFV